MKQKLLFALIALLASGCLFGQDKANIYENCCGDEAKVFDIQGMKIYVPNIITPNGDGINDAFYPIASNMKKGEFAVANFQVFDTSGLLIFLMPGMDVEKLDVWSFTGVASKRPHMPDEFLNYEYTGRFTYKFMLAVNNKKGGEEIIEVSGSACVVRCDKDAKIIKLKNKCAFPSQGLGGVFDKSKSTKETTCIE